MPVSATTVSVPHVKVVDLMTYVALICLHNIPKIG